MVRIRFSVDREVLDEGGFILEGKKLVSCKRERTCVAYCGTTMALSMTEL